MTPAATILSYDYHDIYGGTVFLSIFIILLFLLAVSFLYVINNTVEINKNWDKYKCRPYIIPFASYIRGKEAGATNFRECTNVTLSDILAPLLTPIVATIGATKSGIKTTLAASREALNGALYLQKMLSSIVEAIWRQITRAIPVLQKVTDALKASMNTISGMFSVITYSLYSLHLLFRKLLAGVGQSFVSILYIMAGVIPLLWLSPVSWGVAGALTVQFVAISTMMIIMVAFLKNVIGVHIRALPKLKKRRRRR